MNNPYKNEHAARLRDPKQFKEFARANDRGGRGIHFVFGIKNGSSFIQAIRFDKKLFTVAEAKAWLQRNHFKPIKFEPARESVKKNPQMTEAQYRKILVKMLEDEQEGIEKYKKLALSLPINPEANKIKRVLMEIAADEERHEKLLLRLIYF